MALIKLHIDNTDLVIDADQTFLSTDSSASAASLIVDSINKFTTNQILLIGTIGAEKSEIIKTHAVTGPSGTTVTLASNTVYAHNRGDTVTIISWDQYALSHATTSTGSKTVLTTTLGSGLIAIDPESTETLYNESEYTSGGYFVRKYNSISATYSTYSGFIPYTGLLPNTAGEIIREAFLGTGEKLDDIMFTKEFLYSALNEGRMEIDRHPAIERWSFRTVFDYDAGDVIAGVNHIDLPSNMRDPDTQKNLLTVRIGRNNLPLTYIDKRGLNDFYRGVAHTTLIIALADSDVTMTLTSSGDFDESGALSIAGTLVSDAVDSVSYTSNVEATGVLSGITGIVTGGHAVGTDVWQGASFGIPTKYSVYEGKIVFSQPFADQIAGENIWLDYYKQLTRITSDSDELDEPFYHIYLPYLRFRIKLRKNPLLQLDTDPDYKKWIEERDVNAMKENIGQDIRLIIDVPR